MKHAPPVLLLFLFVISACSTTKSLKKDEALYTGSSIHIKKVDYDDKWKIEKASKKVSLIYYELWDTPNSAIMGLPLFQGIPSRLWIYNMFYTKKDRGFARWMRKNFGEEPITIEDISPGLKVRKAVNIYESYGHFGTTADFRLNYSKKGNKARIRYDILVPKPYRYRNILFEDDTAKRMINESFLDYNPLTSLHENGEFNLATIKKERSDIWNHLQNSGYYFVNEDDISIDADTTVGYKQMDIRVGLNNLSTRQQMPQNVDNLEIEIGSYPYSSQNSNYIDWGFGRIRKKLMHDLIPVKAKTRYSLSAANKTIRNLTETGIFTNPTIEYVIGAADSSQLNAKVRMDPVNATSIDFNIRGNYKNSGYIGPSIGLDLSQLNIFGGAENLTISLDAYYDFPIGAYSERVSNSSGFSVRSMLSSPLLSSPFRFIKADHSLPKQLISLNADFNDRKDYFKIAGWNMSYGYAWKSSPKVTHRLDLINATYSDIIESTPRFDTLVAENPALRASLADQFIVGSSYIFKYDNSEIQTKKLGTYFEGNVDLSGNSLSLINAAFTNREAGERTFLGVKYAQYIRLRYDFRAYWRLGTNSHLAFRNLFGIGFSYGNSSQMPYIKQFSIGGSTSLRSFTARSLAPGGI